MTGQETAAELLRQIRDGVDIPAARQLLSRVKPSVAARVPPDAPYSVLTNLAHAVFWQDVWLRRLSGTPDKSRADWMEELKQDWKEPEPEEWPELVERFLKGSEDALEIAMQEPFRHRMKSDELAIKTLLAIAIHNAYHIGQINLLKRMVRKRASEKP